MDDFSKMTLKEGVIFRSRLPRVIIWSAILRTTERTDMEPYKAVRHTGVHWIPAKYAELSKLVQMQ